MQIIRLGVAHLILTVILGLLACPVFAQDSLRQRQQAALADRQALRAELQKVQKNIANSELAKNDIANVLKESEQKISAINNILHDYDKRQADLHQSLAKLISAKDDQTALLATQRAALAKQMRAQYASGLSSWSTILSGQDPQDINRELTYLSYVLKLRVNKLDEVQQTIISLDRLREKIQASQAELVKLKEATASEQEKLLKEQQIHQAKLAKIKKQLANEQARAKKLQARDKLLGDLVKQLDEQIAKARAEQKRKAEIAAQKRAERAKQAA